jgi:transcriptional regulator with XRE-family HTH domain
MTASCQGASAAPAAAHGARVKAMRAVVGSFFRDLREKQRLTQDQVAVMTRELGLPLSRATISAMETGRHMPGLDVAAILSGVYREDVRRVIERLELVDPAPVDLSAESHETLSLRAYDAFKAGDHLRAVHL